MIDETGRDRTRGEQAAALMKVDQRLARFRCDIMLADSVACRRDR
ncbi:hypothetical protein [Atlantibacter hermannii]|nr:hypothetical protein [Atlantibacter hermannii]